MTKGRLFRRIALAVTMGVVSLAAPALARADARYQMFYGGSGDPNVYCSGGCGTNSCCVVNGTPVQ